MSKVARYRPRQQRKESNYPVLTSLDISMDLVLRIVLTGCCFALMMLLLATRGQQVTRFAGDVASHVVQSLSRTL